MRIAIVDDLAEERALLKARLSRLLSLRGAEAELLEFDSGEAFLAAEKERRFTAAFLDIYMHGMSGMDAAKALRRTDTDCLLIFTTPLTDHALEGFQVRALHYLVKPFSETELSGLLDEMLAKLPRPEPGVPHDGRQPRLCQSGASEICPAGVYGISAAKGACGMKDVLRPMLELSVVIPGLLFAYFPVKSYLKQTPGKLALWLLPLMTRLCIVAGILCYHFRVSTALASVFLTLLAIGPVRQNAPHLPLEIRNDRAFGSSFLVQRDFSSDGEQPQPQRPAAAGKPAPFHATAAL